VVFWGESHQGGGTGEDGDLGASILSLMFFHGCCFKCGDTLKQRRYNPAAGGLQSGDKTSRLSHLKIFPMQRSTAGMAEWGGTGVTPVKSGVAPDFVGGGGLGLIGRG
jgi:hypothetical protein